jgi:hypothetical protein
MANLTAIQLEQLSDSYQDLAQELIQFKLNHAASLNALEFQDLSSRIGLILHNSNLMAALSTVVSVQDLTPQLNSLTQSTAAINHALATITSVQKVIDIATLVVNLGTSVLTGNVTGIINNISGLATAIAGV